MAEPLTVVHLARAHTPEAARQLVLLAGGLVARQVSTVAVGPLQRQTREELTRRNVRWVNTPIPDSLNPRDHAAGRVSLARLLQAVQPDLIHAHDLPCAVAARLAVSGVESRPPLVCSLYELPPPPAGPRWRHPGQRRALRALLNQCSALLVSSDAARQSLLRLTGNALNPETELAVIPVGVEPRPPSNLFDVGVKRQRVGLHPSASIVATMVPLDGSAPVEAFLEAASLVSEQMANIEFVLIGEGPRVDAYKALAHQLRLSGCTVFLGRRPDALDIVSTCNVYVALADGPWGVSQTLEAVARELRIVALDLPSLREAFEGIATIPLVPAHEPQQLARALRHQLEQYTVEEEKIQANTGLSWGISEVLASQDEFDLDRPGLDARDRTADPTSDAAQLLQKFSGARMTSATVAVYNRVLGRHGEQPRAQSTP
jgi:glycosyltransferase involved in cell wall biosynthesis